MLPLFVVGVVNFEDWNGKALTLPVKRIHLVEVRVVEAFVGEVLAVAV